MKVLYACCFLLLFLCTSCEQEQLNQPCDVAEPTQNIEWLRKRVQELQTSDYCQFVQQGMWNGRSVFVLSTCEPGINSFDSVYDCDGNLLCFAGDDTCPTFSKEIKEYRVIWTNGK